MTFRNLSATSRGVVPLTDARREPPAAGDADRGDHVALHRGWTTSGTPLLLQRRVLTCALLAVLGTAELEPDGAVGGGPDGQERADAPLVDLGGEPAVH